MSARARGTNGMSQDNRGGATLTAEPDFRTLEERDFIRLRSGSSIPGQREYAIKHALTREVAYASLPRARRARLHAGFAAWLERFAGASGDEFAPLLAHHYAEAVRSEDLDRVPPEELLETAAKIAAHLPPA